MLKGSTLVKISTIAALIVAGLYLFFRGEGKKELPVIAITQIIDHNTLDTVRKGLIIELAKRGVVDGETTKIIYQNANGNVTVASQIAKQFIPLKPKVIIALSTQSAQLLKQPAKEAGIPLVFSAVTDPVAAKLVKNFKDTADGITGVSDFMPAEPQIDMISTFLPNLKVLGVVFNPSEINSVSFIDVMEKVANKRGIKFLPVAINSTAEASSAITSVIGKVDALYFPNDNTAMAAAAAIAQVALKHKLPVFANDLASVELGVMAALSYDRLAMGAKTASIVLGLLNNQSTADFPVTNDVPIELVVNKKTLEAININLPEKLATPARFVN